MLTRVVDVVVVKIVVEVVIVVVVVVTDDVGVVDVVEGVVLLKGVLVYGFMFAFVVVDTAGCFMVGFIGNFVGFDHAFVVCCKLNLSHLRD